ncbi:MAG: YbdD/YjiX family protein [Candidatus Acidiferrales bacterium]
MTLERTSPLQLGIQLWSWLRQVSGDAAYENYLRAIQRGAATSPGPNPPLSRRDFYLDALRRRYSTVSRCC